MLVGGSAAQPPVTPALVHVMDVLPADPERASPALHVDVANVEVPEKVSTVAVPVIVPFFATVPFVVCHVPLTLPPLCVSVMVTVCVA
jgi:hypothetical protein